MILNAEPYFNEAGYERQRGTVEGGENSRMYNEMAVIKTMESVRNMVKRPPTVFREEIQRHFKERLPWYEFCFLLLNLFYVGLLARPGVREIASSYGFKETLQPFERPFQPF